MPRLRIIVVDRTKAGFLREGEDFYRERIKRYSSLEWIEIKPVKMIKGKSGKEIMAAEARAIRKVLTARDCLIALDRGGQSLRSEALAQWLDRLPLERPGPVTFLIGGPLGLDAALLKQAHRILALSQFTLTHEMARLILLEQLYRAFTILKGEKYHK